MTMATLSRNTLGIALQWIASWSRTSIEAFLYRLDVPDELIAGDSKLKLVLNVFRGLERLGRQDLLAQIIFQAAESLEGDTSAWLQEALMRDGFVVGDGELAPDVPLAEENRTALEILVEKHAADLDVETLNHHLQENTDLFRQEKWDSSVSHARNFVEQLLDDIARAIAGNRAESPALDRPAEVREYLHRSGFLDEAEKKKLADGVYGFFSEEGSHPGISTQSAARVCMHVLWAFSYYLLEKFENWRRDNP